MNDVQLKPQKLSAEIGMQVLLRSGGYCAQLKVATIKEVSPNGRGVRVELEDDREADAPVWIDLKSFDVVDILPSPDSGNQATPKTGNTMPRWNRPDYNSCFLGRFLDADNVYDLYTYFAVDCTSRVMAVWGNSNYTTCTTFNDPHLSMQSHNVALEEAIRRTIALGAKPSPIDKNSVRAAEISKQPLRFPCKDIEFGDTFLGYFNDSKGMDYDLYHSASRLKVAWSDDWAYVDFGIELNPNNDHYSAFVEAERRMKQCEGATLSGGHA